MLSLSRGRPMRQRIADTRLDRFIRENELKPAHVAREAGCSRKHLLALRMGRVDPTRGMMIAIAGACATLLHRPVFIAHLFDTAPTGGER
jgi:hypothetical protein